MSERTGTRNLQRRILLTLAAAMALASWMGLNQQVPPPITPSEVQTEGRVIDRIVFEGLITLDASYLQGVARIATGSVWNKDEIARACARLAETGKFEGVPYAVAREENGRLVLVFVVKERPFIQEITFVGNAKFKASDLLGEVQIGVGSAISDFQITQAREAIERKYKEAGYAYVKVDVDAEALRAERRLIFRISEGPRIKVRHIVFEGNRTFGRLELLSKIETSTYIWIFRTGAFDEETAQRDAAAIKKYYTDRGFLNAQVGYRTDIVKDTDLTITFQIEEGLRHRIKTITFEGVRVFSTDRLAELMRLKVGVVIDADVLTEDRKRILDEYGGQGYIYAEVTTTHVFAEEDGWVHLTVSVKEREQYRFGRIVVRGNRQTRDKVVRRELRFYPEELYNTVETRKAEQRLTETRLFKEATITPQGELPGVRDALVDVTEDSTSQIIFGVGVTSNSGLVGSITLEQRNFDLFDWPRDTRELFHGRAFKGAGQTLRLQLEPGTEFTRASLEFREPYLFDRELGYNLSAYLFERSRGPYTERRIGFSNSIDKRFREGPLAGWAAEIAARVEHIDISDVDWFSARDIEEVEGGSWLTSLKGTLVRDRTDSRWLPSTGNRFRVAWEQAGALGGSYTFGKLTSEFDQYYTVARDRFDRKHIVQWGASAGNIFGDAPVFERFYAGGMGSIRGFDFRGISPRAGLRDDPIGGDFTLLTNAQYSFPLVGTTLRGVAFTDMGTVERNFELTGWRASIGVGARLYIKYFGPIPLAFDIAVPVAKEDDDDLQWFSFSFATTF